jgi:PKD repeat protein
VRRLLQIATPAAVTAMLMLPGTALASVGSFCVVPASGCTPANTYGTFSGAMTAVADDHVDTSATIQLGATAYNEDDDYYGGTIPLTITGAGEGQTILDGIDTDIATVLSIEGVGSGAAVTVQDLSVEIPEAGGGAAGIENDGASPLTVKDVSVTDSGATAGGSVGLSLNANDVASHVTIDMTQPTDEGISGGTIEDSRVSGDTGLYVHGKITHVIRSTISGTATAAVDVEPTGTFSAQDCLFLQSNGAVDVEDNKGASVSIEQSTLSGDDSSTGINVSASGSLVPVTFHASIIDPLLRRPVSLSGSGVAFSDTDDDFVGATSAANPNGVAVSGGATFVPGVGNIDADPKFVNPGVDLRLLPGSPAMNQISAPLGPADSTTDLLGNPRVVDGAPKDMGAYQHQAPTARASVSAAGVEARVPARFSAVGSSVNPGDSFTYRWSFDDGTTATGASVAHAFVKSGVHHATVTVTGAGAAGFSTTATASVVVTAAPGKPSASRAALTGVAKGKPKLAFTVAAGKAAPALKSLAISLPKGLSFVKKAKRLVAGIALKAHGKRLKFSVKVSHGVLTITLKTAATSSAATISRGAISASANLTRQVKHKHARKLPVGLRVIDAAGAKTKLTLSLKPS